MWGIACNESQLMAFIPLCWCSCLRTSFPFYFFPNWTYFPFPRTNAIADPRSVHQSRDSSVVSCRLLHLSFHFKMANWMTEFQPLFSHSTDCKAAEHRRTDRKRQEEEEGRRCPSVLCLTLMFVNWFQPRLIRPCCKSTKVSQILKRGGWYAVYVVHCSLCRIYALWDKRIHEIVLTF